MQENYSYLFTDLNLFLKLVKQKQDNHFMLIQYLHKISQPETSNNVFLDQQLLLHYKFRQNLLNKDRILSESYFRVQDNLLEPRKVEGEGFKLFQKSLVRVIEICQLNVERINFNQGLYQYQFKCFKEGFSKYQAENNFIGVIGYTSGYLREKYEIDYNLLNRLIEMIENGEKEEMEEVIKERYELIRLKMQEEKWRLAKIKEEEARMMKERQKQKEEERNRLEERMRLAQEMQKTLNKNRKKVNKFAETVIFKIYQPMAQFSRAQYLQDILYVDEYEKRQRLLTEIKQRNKAVKSELTKFISYSSNMELKIKVFELKQKQKEKERQKQRQRQKQKQTRKFNSSPKFNFHTNKSSPCSKPHSVSGKKMDADISIDTVSQLPLLKDKKLKLIPSVKIYQQTLEGYAPNLVFQVPQKQGIFIKNFGSQKIQYKSQPRSLSPKPLSIFQTIKVSGQKRKQSLVSEGLPHINISQRVSFDMNKTKVTIFCRSNPKVLQFNNKSRRKSETPRKTLNLVQVNVANKFSLKLANQTTSQIHNLKRILKGSNALQL